MNVRVHAGWFSVGAVLVALTLYRASTVGPGLALLVALAGALICAVSLSRR